MVDVGHKAPTDRRAVAQAFVRMCGETVSLLRGGGVPKGDALAVARVAGIMAAKETSRLVPLAHPLPLTRVAVDVRLEDEGARITTTVETHARTGVEMEALTGASVAALALYDMCKAVDKAMVISDVELLCKEGGVSGTWGREPSREA